MMNSGNGENGCFFCAGNIRIRRPVSAAMRKRCGNGSVLSVKRRVCGQEQACKTALARAYIRKHRQDYDAVLFLSCQADLKSVICDDCQLPIVNLQYSADKIWK